MLEKIKLLLGLTDNTKDDLILILIEQAANEAQDYTHNNNLAELDTSITQMVVYKYNRLGTEGLNSEGYSGASFNYATDYPDSILRLLKSKRKVVVI